MTSDHERPGWIGALRLLPRPAILVALSALIVAGKFDSFDLYGTLHYIVFAVLLGLILFETAVLVDTGAEDRTHLFYLGAWLMTAVRLAVHSTGAMDSFLYPAAYLLFAVLAGVLGPLLALALAVIFLAQEAGWMMLGSGLDQALLIEHAAYLAVFGSVVGVFVYLERREKARAHEILRRLKSDASEFQRDDTVYRMEGLSDGGRKKKSLKSVFSLDEAFFQALDTGRLMMEADVMALYWRPGAGGPFHLREASSSKEVIEPGAAVIEGEGLIGWSARHRQSVRASGKRLRDSLPYRKKGLEAEHLLAMPVFGTDDVQGVLVADRENDLPFTDEDEKLMNALAYVVKEVHGNALLMQRAEAEASQFRSLSELSRRLSKSLDLDDIVEAVIRTSRALTGHDGVAVVLDGEVAPGRGLRVAGTGGEVDESHKGEAIDASHSLAGMVVESTRPLSIPDMARREDRTPALAKKIDPPGMNSVLLQPLPFKRDARGALVFFGKDRNAFSDYVVRATGILADIAAVSIYNSILYAEMERRAVTDGLTGLFNHRWFQGRLSEEIERAGRLGNKVAVLICDIDHFKRVNDTYGHPVGDVVLKGVARVLSDSIRKVDSAARYGGEEFVVILVGTGEKGACEFAERLRKKIGAMSFESNGDEFRVTLSIGIAVYPDDESDKKTLIESADAALYRAKESGRNRVVAGSGI